MKITNAQVRCLKPDHIKKTDEIEKIHQTLRADCYGNNAAIECPRCLSYPVLLIALPNQRGSSSSNPAVCRHCGAKIYIIDDLSNESQNGLEIVNLAISC